MKIIYLLVITFFISLNLSATVSKNNIIRGLIKSFDKKTITLEVGDKKVDIDRNKFDKELVPRARMIVDVQLTDKEFAELKSH